jgi:hypothetical protein
MNVLKISFACLFVLFYCSCSTDRDDSKKALFAVPTIKSLASIRSSVSVSQSRRTNSEGKIYVAENYLFYIAKEGGVHVFDNHNPASPLNIAFINIAGVHDIAVKGNFLYADNFIDLVVFDISNIQNITLVRTVENAISFNPTYPNNAEFYDYNTVANNDEIITGYGLEYRDFPEGNEYFLTCDATASFLSSNTGGTIGTGGSYARFQINRNALYTLDNYRLNVFNISNPVATFYDKSIYMTQWINAGEFETLFIQKDYLFVGATSGMHVIDATDEFNPAFISGFSHATGCDPVFVYGHYAYITVKGGSTCGAIQDQINVIDVADITNPVLVFTYFVSKPQGLGIRNNAIYVGCGSEGLKIFNNDNPSQLVLENSYSEPITDVIPLDSHLITVGPNKIIQYNYGVNFTLQQISVLNF